MTYLGIIDKRQQRDQRWLVRINLGDNNTALLWFLTNPNESDVEAAANEYIAKVANADPTVVTRTEAQKVIDDNANCRETILGIVVKAQELIALGVPITGWSYQAVVASADAACLAIEAEPTITLENLLRYNRIMRISMALMNYWSLMVYYCYGEPRVAYELWPYLVAIAQQA